MKIRSFYSVFFILFILLGLLLLYQNYQLRKDLIYSKRLLEFSNNPYVDLIQLKQIIRKYIVNTDIGNNAKWKLVIIFSPETCPVCLEEVSYWVDFCMKKNDLQCWGLVDHPHKELVLSFIKSKGWEFSNLYIDDTLLGNNFNLAETPIKILLDENHIYYVEKTLPEWKKESILKKMIKDLKLN
jgi:hypothetical protein